MGNEEIFVTIGRPRPFEDKEDYYCPYSIEYAGKKKTRYAGGVDAIQALQLVFKRIGADLFQLAEQSGVSITWLEDTPGFTGFPQ